MAMPRCNALASVSLKIPKLKVNGSGEAYHNWNPDHITAPQNNTAPVMPPTSRPPRSTSATNCSRLALVAAASVVEDVVLMLILWWVLSGPGLPWYGSRANKLARAACSRPFIYHCIAGAMLHSGYSRPFTLTDFSAPGCGGADRPCLAVSLGWRWPNAGCSFLKSSNLSTTAFTIRYTVSSGTSLDETEVSSTPLVLVS